MIVVVFVVVVQLVVPIILVGFVVLGFVKVVVWRVDFVVCFFPIVEGN